ncbi:MAG: L28 family ribosomal protein [bacterium]|nr:L28 family ribosomal protein [bacterium]
MSRQCTFCQRSSLKAASRSHSNIRTLRRQYVNLQRKRFEGTSFLICARCIKTMKKSEPVKTVKQPAEVKVAAAAKKKTA